MHKQKATNGLGDKMDIWDKRRRNLRAIIAISNSNPTQVARESGLSVNALNKFLKGDSNTMRWSSLEKVCETLSLPSITLLDLDNPFSDAKYQLYQMVNEMTEEQAADALDRLKD